MNVRITILCFLVAAISHTESQAQTDFFWSFRDLNSGATNSAAFGNFQVGDYGSLFMYYSTNGPADSDLSVGAFLDIATSATGVIEFTQAETFDFSIEIAGIPIDNRWLDEQGGGGSAGETGDLSANFIHEWHAFTVTGGQGIQEQNGSPIVFMDLGYDVVADAFLFGRIDFTVIGVGSVDLITARAGQIVNGNEVVPATFGNATIIVSVPEPTTAGMFAVCVLAMSVIRRR